MPLAEVGCRPTMTSKIKGILQYAIACDHQGKCNCNKVIGYMLKERVPWNDQKQGWDSWAWKAMKTIAANILNQAMHQPHPLFFSLMEENYKAHWGTDSAEASANHQRELRKFVWENEPSEVIQDLNNELFTNVRIVRTLKSKIKIAVRSKIKDLPLLIEEAQRREDMEYQIQCYSKQKSEQEEGVWSPNGVLGYKSRDSQRPQETRKVAACTQMANDESQRGRYPRKG